MRPTAGSQAAKAWSSSVHAGILTAGGNHQVLTPVVSRVVVLVVDMVSVVLLNLPRLLHHPTRSVHACSPLEHTLGTLGYLVLLLVVSLIIWRTSHAPILKRKKEKASNR